MSIPHTAADGLWVRDRNGNGEKKQDKVWDYFDKTPPSELSLIDNPISDFNPL